MPRYFLDFTDTGELLRDDEGMELVDLEAARMEALASLGEIAKDQLRDGGVDPVRPDTRRIGI
jgi:hypothetical protein